MTFTPVPNFCEENVWRRLQDPSDNPRWAVFISTEDQRCTFWAQVSQTDDGGPVIWDYHVVMLEQGPDGFTVWDPDCTAGSLLASQAWTQANFPLSDPDVRFRVVEAAELVRDFRSDRRHMKGSTPPSWPVVSPGESNLESYTSVAEGGPGTILDLDAWISFTSPGFR